MTSELQERLLSIMDRKHHWAWPAFTRPGLSRAQLLVHFRNEYHVYVRDFPVLLARVLGQGPPAAVRAALAENIFEEETGKLSLGISHPELFIEMMGGLGFSRSEIESAELAPEAREYRAYLDRVSVGPPWVVGAAVLTIFVEGSVHERATMTGTRHLPSADEIIAKHPMVVHYGCSPERMRLVRAHRAVEGAHRDEAWGMILSEVKGSEGADAVVFAVEEASRLWQKYRDGVARLMGLSPGQM